MSSTIIKVNNIDKIFKSGSQAVRVLTNVSFEMSSNELVLILGPSGAGKSTFLNLISGIEEPTVGEIFFQDVSYEDMKQSDKQKIWRNEISFVFQDFISIDYLTVFENIEFLILNIEKKERRKIIMELLEKLGIRDLKKKYPHEISGGERQRLSLAIALCTRPSLIILDEPTANLDFDNANKIITLLFDLKETFKTSIIIASHDLKFKKIADRIIEIKNGKFVDIK